MLGVMINLLFILLSERFCIPSAADWGRIHRELNLIWTDESGVDNRFKLLLQKKSELHNSIK